MSRRLAALSVGIITGVAIFFLWMWSAKGQDKPQSFPAPVDPAGVRMMIVGHTMQLLVPSGKVTVRPAMTSGVSVIEVNLGTSVPAPTGK